MNQEQGSKPLEASEKLTCEVTHTMSVRDDPEVAQLRLPAQGSGETFQPATLFECLSYDTDVDQPKYEVSVRGDSVPGETQYRGFVGEETEAIPAALARHLLRPEGLLTFFLGVPYGS